MGRFNFSKITARWLVNSLGLIFVILLALALAFALGTRWFYYNGVRQALLTRSGVVTGLLENYAADPSVDYATQVRRMVETFDQRHRMELMAIDGSGQVLVTSSGFSPAGQLELPDYEQALHSEDGTGEYLGTLWGEPVMAVTALSPVQNDQVSAIRIMVSLSTVNQAIWTLNAVTILVMVVILLFVVLSGLYFINSIVIPVGEIGKSARKIAQGDFNIRLEPKNDDEIGQLCDTINHMAEALANSEQLKNDFISSVSHELRTPLTAIRGWVETLQADGGGDPQLLQKGMRIISSEADRLSLMVEELLDFSRIQSGRMQLVTETIDLFAELDEAALMYAERARQEQIALQAEIDETPAPVMGDRNRLRQVFINIIDNAIKYSDQGGQVTVRAWAGAGWATVQVQDRGCGISSEDLPKIKEKFYKANLTRRGSGIGLAVADEIVRLHQGELTIDSVQGEGTTVTIRLPLAGGEGKKAPAGEEQACSKQTDLPSSPNG